jgi:hypothetical protein
MQSLSVHPELFCSKCFSMANGNLLITVAQLDMLYIACWQKDFAKK